MRFPLKCLEKRKNKQWKFLFRVKFPLRTTTTRPLKTLLRSLPPCSWLRNTHRHGPHPLRQAPTACCEMAAASTHPQISGFPAPATISRRQACLLARTQPILSHRATKSSQFAWRVRFPAPATQNARPPSSQQRQTPTHHACHAKLPRLIHRRMDTATIPRPAKKGSTAFQRFSSNPAKFQGGDKKEKGSLDLCVRGINPSRRTPSYVVCGSSNLTSHVCLSLPASALGLLI